MAAVVLPSLNLHWLPSIIANPNITLNPGQIASLSHLSGIGGGVGAGGGVGGIGGGAGVGGVGAGGIAPTPTSGAFIKLPTGAVVTQAGGIFQVPTGIASTPSYTGLQAGGGFTPQGSLQSSQLAIGTVIPVTQQSGHFESEVPGGSEKERTELENGLNRERQIMAESTTLIPPIRIPLSSTTIPSSYPSAVNMGLTPSAVNMGLTSSTAIPPAIVAAVPAIFKSMGEETEDQYMKEINAVISPKGIIFNITIHTVILSAFVFIALLTWFEVIRTWYDQTFDPTLGIRNVDLIFVRFWYAVFVTCIILILIYILYRWSKESK